MTKERTPENILSECVEKNHMWSVLSSSYRGRYEPGLIGQAILRLSPADRAVLANLRSKDVENVRWPTPYGLPNPSKMTVKVFKLPHEKS